MSGYYGDGEVYSTRYHTHAAAKAGHDRIVAALRDGVDLDEIEVES